MRRLQRTAGTSLTRPRTRPLGRVGLAVACLMFGLLAACDLVPGAHESDPGSETSMGGGGSVEGLTSEFLALVMPISGEDLRLGYQSYQASSLLAAYRSLGSCLEAEGFEALAKQVRSVTIPKTAYPEEMWLFPNLQDLRAAPRTGSPPTAIYLLNYVMIGTPDDATAAQWIVDLESDIEANPQWGVSPTDAERLWTLINDDCTVYDVGLTDLLVAADGRKQAWMEQVRQLDESETISSTFPQFVDCASLIRPEFAEVETPEEWVAAFGGVWPTVDQTELQRIRSEFADCVEPVVEARTAPRIELRGDAVNLDGPELIEFEAQLEEAIGD